MFTLSSTLPDHLRSSRPSDSFPLTDCKAFCKHILRLQTLHLSTRTDTFAPKLEFDKF